jgi:phenylpropionate dioxygenase-like ring-hydroxylating dioxygenase large terminal subunit
MTTTETPEVSVHVRPGDARCPGPSAQDLIRLDSTPAPEPLLETSYEFEGDADVPFSRYTSREQLAAELEHVFYRTWQWACREDQLPKPGSYYIYDVGHRSAIVVRTDDGSIKAYNNFCLHRGTQLKPSASVGRSKLFRCPFHGWTWSLEGDLVDLPCDWDFPHVDREKFHLPELQVGTWGGFVFVNFDERAPSLQEYLGVLPRHFEHWDLADRFVEVHARKRLPANWKASMEAFLEAYHVLETHSQAVINTGDANAVYDVFGDNVTRFIHTTGTPSPHLKDRPSDQELVDKMFARKFPDEASMPRLKEGETARSVYADYVKREFGAKYGRDFSALSISETIDSIEYFLFPNQIFFPGLSLSMVYRFRPDPENPDFCLFDLMIMRPKPLDGPAPRDAEPFDLDVDDSYALTPNIDKSLAFVYDQDTSNLAAQTRGFKGSVKRAQTLGNYQEVRARHLHNMIDKYIAAGIRR